MSCAYRSHRYRASVTPHPASLSWGPTTGHAHHPALPRPPVVRPHRQAVLATADDAPIPVSLVQYLWSRWHQVPPEDRGSVARFVGTLMRSPRWHWDVTVLPDHSLRDPQHPFVTERDGRPTIGMPIDMLRTIWTQVVEDLSRYSPTTPSIVQRFVSITDPALWQELWQEVCVIRNRAEQSTKRFLQRKLYGYLSPRRLPEIAHEIRRLLHSNAPDDQYTALTVLTRWLASPDHETRIVAAQMLHGWTHVVAALVRSHPSDDAIRTMLDRLVPTILTATRPDDRAAWVTTLWEVVTDPTCFDGRRQMSAHALKRMMIHDPMVAALVCARLRTVPLTHPSFSAPVWNILIAGLMRTGVAGEVLEEVLEAIEQAIREDRHTIPQLDLVLAACWGTGHDHRILQIIDAVPGSHWHTVLTEGVTASVGAEVCDRIQSWFPPDQATALIVNHIRAREERGDWPLAPLPASLIPWVGKAAHSYPDHLPSNTIRRLWLANPNDAWNVTQTMFRSGHPRAQKSATAAMDAGWGTGHDVKVATILRSITLDPQNDPNVVRTGITTIVAGLGTAPPSIMEPLLTALVMQGNETVRQQLISVLHRGWGRGQDALVMRIVEKMIAERDPSKWGWSNARATLEQAWRYLPPDVVVSLINQLVTREMNRWPTHPMYPWRTKIDDVIAALAPIWTALPPSQVIASITRHVAHLHTHAHALKDANTRDELIAAWASVIAAGADRLSAADLHALLDPLWTISPHGCITGVAQWVDR
jgi:hypothetical protein